MFEKNFFNSDIDNLKKSDNISVDRIDKEKTNYDKVNSANSYWKNIFSKEHIGTMGNKKEMNNDIKIEKNNEINEKVIGGKYSDVRKSNDENHDAHHMPAKSSLPENISINDGPAISMTKEDHRKTASCGNSMEAREYREKQKKYIENGEFRKAFEMDKKDIQEKFGNKYDKEIAQVEKYIDKLEAEGKLNGK